MGKNRTIATTLSIITATLLLTGCGNNSNKNSVSVIEDNSSIQSDINQSDKNIVINSDSSQNEENTIQNENYENSIVSVHNSISSSKVYTDNFQIDNNIVNTTTVENKSSRSYNISGVTTPLAQICLVARESAIECIEDSSVFANLVGEYTIEVSLTDENLDNYLLFSYGGVESEDGFESSGYIYAPIYDSENANINPFTTIISSTLFNDINLTKEEALEKVSTTLNIDEALLLASKPIDSSIKDMTTIYSKIKELEIHALLSQNKLFYEDKKKLTQIYEILTQNDLEWIKTLMLDKEYSNDISATPTNLYQEFQIILPKVIEEIATIDKNTPYSKEIVDTYIDTLKILVESYIPNDYFYSENNETINKHFDEFKTFNIKNISNYISNLTNSDSEIDVNELMYYFKDNLGESFDLNESVVLDKRNILKSNIETLYYDKVNSRYIDKKTYDEAKEFYSSDEKYKDDLEKIKYMREVYVPKGTNPEDLSKALKNGSLADPLNPLPQEKISIGKKWNQKFPGTTDLINKVSSKAGPIIGRILSQDIENPATKEFVERQAQNVIDGIALGISSGGIGLAYIPIMMALDYIDISNKDYSEKPDFAKLSYELLQKIDEKLNILQSSVTRANEGIENILQKIEIKDLKSDLKDEWKSLRDSYLDNIKSFNSKYLTYIKEMSNLLEKNANGEVVLTEEFKIALEELKNGNADKYYALDAIKSATEFYDTLNPIKNTTFSNFYTRFNEFFTRPNIEEYDSFGSALAIYLIEKSSEKYKDNKSHIEGSKFQEAPSLLSDIKQNAFITYLSVFEDIYSMLTTAFTIQRDFLKLEYIAQANGTFEAKEAGVARGQRINLDPCYDVSNKYLCTDDNLSRYYEYLKGLYTEESTNVVNKILGGGADHSESYYTLISLLIQDFRKGVEMIRRIEPNHYFYPKDGISSYGDIIATTANHFVSSALGNRHDIIIQIDSPNFKEDGKDGDFNGLEVTKYENSNIFVDSKEYRVDSKKALFVEVSNKALDKRDRVEVSLIPNRIYLPNTRMVAGRFQYPDVAIGLQTISLAEPNSRPESVTKQNLNKAQIQMVGYPALYFSITPDVNDSNYTNYYDKNHKVEFSENLQDLVQNKVATINPKSIYYDMNESITYLYNSGSHGGSHYKSCADVSLKAYGNLKSSYNPKFNFSLINSHNYLTLDIKTDNSLYSYPIYRFLMNGDLELVKDEVEEFKLFEFNFLSEVQKHSSNFDDGSNVYKRSGCRIHQYTPSDNGFETTMKFDYFYKGSAYETSGFFSNNKHEVHLDISYNEINKTIIPERELFYGRPTLTYEFINQWQPRNGAHQTEIVQGYNTGYEYSNKIPNLSTVSNISNGVTTMGPKLIHWSANGKYIDKENNIASGTSYELKTGYPMADTKFNFRKPDFYPENSDRSYFLNHSIDEEISYDEAQNYCKSLSASLPFIHKESYGSFRSYFDGVFKWVSVNKNKFKLNKKYWIISSKVHYDKVESSLDYTPATFRVTKREDNSYYEIELEDFNSDTKAGVICAR